MLAARQRFEQMLFFSLLENVFAIQGLKDPTVNNASEPQVNKSY
jgi:hypothetical protein